MKINHKRKTPIGVLHAAGFMKTVPLVYSILTNNRYVYHSTQVADWKTRKNTGKTQEKHGRKINHIRKTAIGKAPSQIIWLISILLTMSQSPESLDYPHTYLSTWSTNNGWYIYISPNQIKIPKLLCNLSFVVWRGL